MREINDTHKCIGFLIEIIENKKIIEKNSINLICKQILNTKIINPPNNN